LCPVAPSRALADVDSVVPCRFSIVGELPRKRVPEDGRRRAVPQGFDGLSGSGTDDGKAAILWARGVRPAAGTYPGR